MAGYRTTNALGARVLLLIFVVFCSVGALKAQSDSDENRWENWSDSVLSLAEQVNLLAIESSSESIHRFQQREQAFATDSANSEAMISGLRDLLQTPNTSLRESRRVADDINSEQEAIQLRHAREALVQQQIAHFEEVQSALAANIAAIGVLRQRLHEQAPAHAITEAQVLELFQKLTWTMNRLELFQMETQLTLLRGAEAELVSSVRRQDRAVDLYSEILAQGDRAPGDLDFARRCLDLYKSRGDRQRKQLEQFRQRRETLEKAVASLVTQLAGQSDPTTPATIRTDTAEERRILVRQLLEARAATLDELVIILEDQIHSIATAKAGLQQILTERSDVNGRMIQGPQGVIYRGEAMDPPAPVRIDELEELSKHLQKRLANAMEQAAQAKTEVNILHAPTSN